MSTNHSKSIIGGLQDRVEAHLSLLAPVEHCWQPTDYLPDLTAEDWSERLARLARDRGEENLATICHKIAADEARHEVFYTKVVAELFDRDPEGAILAYRTMLRRLIAMPGTRMGDGRDPDLFDHYAAVTQRT